MENLNLFEIIKKLEAKEITSLELIEYYLKKIQDLNAKFNVFLFTYPAKELIAKAKEADKEREKGSSKKLLGIPFTVKDSFMSKGSPTTSGDKFLENTLSEYNATIVERLNQEGAILIGKTNMDSWGFGSTTENSAYGVTKNPYDENRAAGGSSGGSAAAVALDMCAFAIGEDTGGSIRAPAGFCGVYGLKPTYGRVPRYGCIAYASSLDTIGPMSRGIEDLNIIFNIIKGEDGHDLTVDDHIFEGKKYNTFAFSNDFIPDGIQEEVKIVYLETMERFKKLNYKSNEVGFDAFSIVIPTYYITAMSEASTNLSRYQGTRYGSLYNNIKSKEEFAKSQIQTWEDLFYKARTEGFTKEAKRRVFMGAYMLSEGYYDAYYKKAQKIRNKILEDLEKIFEENDFLLSPITPSTALRIGEKTTNPVSMYLEDVYTVTANLAGIPAVAFIVGKDKDGLPIGMQIMGPKSSDERLIGIVRELSNLK